jgi:hypothetical protein
MYMAGATLAVALAPIAGSKKPMSLKEAWALRYISHFHRNIVHLELP